MFSHIEFMKQLWTIRLKFLGFFPLKFGSLTDAVGIDCEMVGVGQGNKSALGRITLVLIILFLCTRYS